MNELMNVDTIDIGLARQFRVSVLITAQPERALAIAQAIVGQSEGLIVQDVHAMDDDEQAELAQMLNAAEDDDHPRIVATSSPGLFDRVRDGRFIVKLFYRLNVIHIVGDSSLDWVDAGLRGL